MEHLMIPGRGRIVRNGTPMDELRIASSSHAPDRAAVARGRIVRRERLEAARESERLLAHAQQQADKLTSEAQQEAEQIRLNAEKQGVELATAKLAAAWLRFETQKATFDEASLDRSIEIARVLAERLLGKSLQLHPDTVVDLAKEAMTQLWRSRHITMHAHPDDVVALEDHIDAFGMPPEQIQIVADRNRKRGCLRFVSDFGEIDGDLGLQLDRLAEAIQQSLGARTSA